jgi:hypothetical protein
MREDTWQRIKQCVKDIVPSTLKTCIWIIKITVGVSFAMMLLKWFGILPWISKAVSPLFKYFGLPGSAALAYVSGYFVNCYTAIAVISTLTLGWREMTILCTMLLCSHSMILETAVLRKTGASGTRMVIVRTLSAIILGLVLNWLLPGRGGEIIDASVADTGEKMTFWLTLWEWFLSTLKLVVMMICIIFSLNIVQRLLSEFGIMNVIARFLSPLMLFFGLPAKSAFLWIVANIVGLAYGAAAMLDEIGRGTLSKRDVNIVDSHICISHSNLEDLSLFAALGGLWWVMLVARWAMSMILVWELRLEYYIKDIVSKK